MSTVQNNLYTKLTNHLQGLPFLNDSRNHCEEVKAFLPQPYDLPYFVVVHALTDAPLSLVIDHEITEQQYPQGVWEAGFVVEFSDKQLAVNFAYLADSRGRDFRAGLYTAGYVERVFINPTEDWAKKYQFVKA